MVKVLAGALALAALPSAFAFRNTSPFFLFSNSETSHKYEPVRPSTSIIQADDLTERIAGFFEKKCPSHTYIVVRQEGVNSGDFLDGASAPTLQLHLSGRQTATTMMDMVPEVVSTVPDLLVAGRIADQCGADLVTLDGTKDRIPPSSTSKRVIHVRFPAPSSARASDLVKYDTILNELISTSADSQDYTVLYFTTAPSEEQASALQADQIYEMDAPFADAVHMELKRDTSLHERADADRRGLFEKYQYFNPGLFMALAATIPLLLVIYVGVSALFSLEVSYFAFSSEMGPKAQQRKAQ